MRRHASRLRDAAHLILARRGLSRHVYGKLDAAWLRSGFVMTETRFRQAFLLLLVTAISAAFVAMIRAFLLTILLAAIFAGLSYPVYQWVLGWLRGRNALAAITTLVLLLALVMAPLLAVLGAGASEALRVTETIRPRLQQLRSLQAVRPVRWWRCRAGRRRQ